MNLIEGTIVEPMTGSEIVFSATDGSILLPIPKGILSVGNGERLTLGIPPEKITVLTEEGGTTESPVVPPGRIVYSGWGVSRAEPSRTKGSWVVTLEKGSTRLLVCSAKKLLTRQLVSWSISPDSLIWFESETGYRLHPRQTSISKS
jgi:hypothetical protein